MRRKARQLNYREEFVEINGIKQYVLHGSENSEKPLLLFLHGGPGSAESPIAYLLQDEWEKFFSVVHWDQRGAGKTYTKNPNCYPTTDLMLEDLRQVVQYLKRQYNQEKVILLGHSWGSVLGSVFVQLHPEDVAYYIGVGQVVSLYDNERVGFEKLKELALAANDKRTLKKLDKIGAYPGENFVMDASFMKKMNIVRSLQGKYNLALKVDHAFLKIMFKSPISEFSDLKAAVGAFKANKSIFEDFLVQFDLNKSSQDYQVPMYYILGDNDWQTPYTLAQEYFSKINAPDKEFFLIPNAGHLTMLDQPKLFNMALEKISLRAR